MKFSNNPGRNTTPFRVLLLIGTAEKLEKVPEASLLVKFPIKGSQYGPKEFSTFSVSLIRSSFYKNDEFVLL